VGAAIVKHTNPCGAAVAGPRPGSCLRAVDLAIAGDPLAAYGGILAVNAPLDGSAAERICGKDIFLEVIVAPAFEPGALEMLRARWTAVRLLETGPATPHAAREVEYRSVPGGMLAQERDTLVGATASWTHAAGPPPTPGQLKAAALVEALARFLTSNAVAIGGPVEGGVRLLGAGAGQVDRLTACRIAAEKAGPLAKGAVAASDAFFPFPDGPAVLIDSGVSMIVHPGGSKRDQETFDLCDQRGVTCMVTGIRHFRH
jgi:phosphoribosylaminoimidazolecarboxamide formyltransferase/IMP cyclohydrolase